MNKPAFKRFPAPYEMSAIQCLHRAGELAGCDIVEAGGAPAHQVYVILRRLTVRGIVKVARREAPKTGGNIRPVYELTAWGNKVHAAIKILSR